MQPENKIFLREKYLKLRKKYLKDELLKKNLLINKKIIFLIKKHKFKNIGLYYSKNNEVDLEETLNFCLENKISCYFPKIINKKIEFVKITKKSELITDKYQIKAPISNNFLKNINIIEIIFCPCIAFNLNYQRIGYGKGYYDKFLKNFFNLKAIVAFNFQKLEEITNFEEYDVKLDLIITETDLLINKNNNFYK
ncbi:5-formyltetrahydrofolate cyclo-ligase [symbiont of Argiope bruennichi]|uniref:5-formyltetrahydrofolate cyclo-ligase n=1 Tax=symbiont of Argiope bruennichi TaxID=2810479 RepID=UPI003DA619FB